MWCVNKVVKFKDGCSKRRNKDLLKVTYVTDISADSMHQNRQISFVFLFIVFWHTQSFLGIRKYPYISWVIHKPTHIILIYIDIELGMQKGISHCRCYLSLFTYYIDHTGHIIPSLSETYQTYYREHCWSVKAEIKWDSFCMVILVFTLEVCSLSSGFNTQLPVCYVLALCCHLPDWPQSHGCCQGTGYYSQRTCQISTWTP